MKILIITTWFYPDTAVAAKRPFYFAKYLSKSGHDVTVVRSGDIYNKLDPNLSAKASGARVITYLGDDCPILKFEKNGIVPQNEASEGRLSFLPDIIRKPLSKFYQRLRRSENNEAEIASVNNRLTRLKDRLALMKENGEEFDIIFSTYGQLENAIVGEYASSLFGCPWILDLRDHMVTKYRGNKFRKEMLKTERQVISSADLVTAVSKDLVSALLKRYPDKRIITLYNGYEPSDNDKVEADNTAELSFCYTGTLYQGQRDLTDLFKALKTLSDNGKIDINKLKFNYAGLDINVLKGQAEKFGLEKILINHGYVDRERAFKLQVGSDIFVVASWNTKDEKGILTGKFYEGIQAKRPILSVISGSEPDSELYEMNKDYNYGICYECCKLKSDFDMLCDFILSSYNAKMQNGRVDYTPNPQFANDFKYETLAGKLGELMKEVVNI